MKLFKNVKRKEKAGQTLELRCASNLMQFSRMKLKIPFQDKDIRKLFATLHQKDSKLLCPSAVR
jgi:hypothetical protein